MGKLYGGGGGVSDEDVIRELIQAVNENSDRQRALTIVNSFLTLVIAVFSGIQLWIMLSG